MLADTLAILEEDMDIGVEFGVESASGFIASSWAKSFDVLNKVWSYNLVNLIPSKDQEYKLNTLIFEILTYGALLRLSLIFLISIAPFGGLRRSLQRVQYRIFGI